MSDTNTPPRPGTNRVRQLLAAIRKTPRKLRIAGIASLVALASTVAFVAAPAAANAATAATTTTNNPTCAIPAGATYQLVYQDVEPANPYFEIPFIYYNESEAFSNGVYYNALTIGVSFDGTPFQALADIASGIDPAIQVDCSTSSTPIYPDYSY